MRHARGLALALVLLARPAIGQTSYPMVTRVTPTAIQRGTSAELTIGGTQNFEGASALLFEGSGVKGEILAAAPAPERGNRRGRRAQAEVKVRVDVAADADLGPRELRVVTPQGVSSVGLVVVVADPVAVEADDKANDEAAGAQPIELPAVVTGVIGKNEDVDWYRIRVEAGRRVTFSVLGNRLEDKIHDLQTHLDPIVQLYDANGRELAVDDNAQFADPRLTYEFKESGTYFVQIRDTTYAGNPGWTYVLHATAGPFATAVFPLAVGPGATAELHAIGNNIDPAQPIRLDIPASAQPGTIALPLPTAGGLTPPVSLVVTDLPRAEEMGDAAEDPDDAPSLNLPVALSGRLAEPNDRDGFRFEAKKGTTYDFEIMARRVGSEADPVLVVVDDKGKSQFEADDTFGKDPMKEWTAPADGTFTVQVRDLHSRGGAGFGYVLLAKESRPDFVATCDPDKLNVGPGARTPVYVKVERRGGFNGPVSLRWDDLPAGVAATPLTIAPELTQGVIVLTGAADARVGGTLASLTAEAEADGQQITHRVEPNQEIYLPGGGRGLYAVETLAVGVADETDIAVEASPEAVTLRPGQTAEIEVTIQRREGFEGPVNLAVDLAHLGRVYASPLPRGVSLKAAGSKTLLGPRETKGKIILEAKADAPAAADVPICVMGHVSINFVVKTAFCSAPIRLTVEK